MRADKSIVLVAVAQISSALQFADPAREAATVVAGRTSVTSLSEGYSDAEEVVRVALQNYHALAQVQAVREDNDVIVSVVARRGGGVRARECIGAYMK